MQQYPKLHNAMWPGLVGKGSDGEPEIDLDTMLRLTADAEVDGRRFDGVDLFLAAPHVPIDATDAEVNEIGRKIAGHGLAVGSVVAPVWPFSGGGSAMGDAQERDRFVEMVRKACRIAGQFRKSGLRTYGVIRIDSAASVEDWAKDPAHNTAMIADTFRRACDVAAEFDERLAIEGEICWGGMHSWKSALELLVAVDRRNIGFQADMAHTLLYTMGYNASEARLLPNDYEWSDRTPMREAFAKVSAALRPWTIDFHVAQNDATVKGGGDHDLTGRHCQVNDPNGKLDVVRDAGFWLRDENGSLTKAFRHICWDGCMFPNDVMLQQQTWNDVLAEMIEVQSAHGWRE
ncbi:xylose isomerase [Rhizobium sp. Root1203]|uniref:sugar phosphate isomerase/epimerase family protein n=1 Tax=Rhizobium sp. Root1203 TaxID=1736427 RepID=UPI00070A9A53|nr:TIM barrel protein [Rhizobium sp. Root1203]KQV23635.1 xylose isomerase [Rhizobium sp. Root1203]